MERSEYFNHLSWLKNALTRVRHPTLMLSLTAGLSFLLYAYAFAGRVSLLKLQAQPRLDGSLSYWADPSLRWHFVVGFTFQFLLYWVGWRFSRVARGKRLWLVVLGGALLSGSALLFMYPFDAADIFDNIMHGRILGVYGGNPFIEPAAHYRSDPFYVYMAWKGATSAYGPLWEILAAGAARLAGDGIIANVLAFKLLPGIFLAGSAIVLAMILRTYAPQRTLSGVLLLSWNPLVLYETFGNGHNDIVMVFWILLAAWALGKHRYTLSVLALVAGTLVKFVPLLFLPAVVFISLHHLPNRAARLRWLALVLVISIALVWLAYAPFWDGFVTLSIERRARLFSASFPALIFQSLEKSFGKEFFGNLISSIAAILTVFYAIFRGWRARADDTWEAFPRASYSILFFYLLLTCLWFQQWYALWPMAFAALLPPGHRARLGVFFSLIVLNKQFVIGPFLLRHRPPIPQPWLEVFFTLGLFLLPWVYAAFILLSKSHEINPNTTSSNPQRLPVRI